ncbi:MAG TPA: hypothetical protein VH419_00120 [Nocardioidaceae bacterium]
MDSLPLVGAEVQRIDVAFTAVSAELAGVLSSLREVDLTSVGTPTADAAVATGMADLQASLTRLRGTADECVLVLRRHGTAESTEASPSDGGDAS